MVVKRPQRCGFKLLPKRWIVERTFGWFPWQRRVNPQVALTDFVNKPLQPVKRKLHPHDIDHFHVGSSYRIDKSSAKLGAPAIRMKHAKL